MKSLYKGGLWLLAGIFTVLANIVTVPSGVGVVAFSPRPDFVHLVVPFQNRWAGEPQSWAWFLVPFWIFFSTVMVLKSIILPI